jgi:hypothetical protein
MERAGLRPEDSVGLIVEDKGYMSTSIGRTTAEQFLMYARSDGKPAALWEIRVPAGTPAGYLNSLATSQDERELLLARGGRLRVVSYGTTTASYPAWGTEYVNVSAPHIVAEWVP